MDVCGAELICEFLEAAFHVILYIREIYPDGVFKKKSKYNVAVMMCVHPDVAEYIQQVCNSLSDTMSKEPVEKVVLCITTEDGEPLEQFVFELNFKTGNVSSASEAMDIEACFRAFLLKLNITDSTLRPLPKGCTFQILVYIQEKISDQLELHQDCPWVRVSTEEQPKSSDFLLVPVKSYSTKLFALQCFVQERENKESLCKTTTPSSS